MDLSSPLPSAFQEDYMMHGEMLFWDFLPEPFDPIPADACLLPPPLDTPVPVLPRSAFSKYVRPEVVPSADGPSSCTSNGGKNIHHRVIELVRGIPSARPENRSAEHNRGFRHMMRERQRRERLSQSYADLYSMLPYRSKADKNSIVQSAATYVRELKGMKEELQRRNEELKVINSRKSDTEGTKIRIRLANSTSTLDSMIGALQCLKAMDFKARAIQTEFSGNELTAIMSIETKVAASEVERALMVGSCR